MKKTTKRIYILSAVFVLAVGFIWFNSSLSSATSSSMSISLKTYLYTLDIFAQRTWYRDFIFYNIRKIAHFFEYFILSLIIIRLYYIKNISLKRFFYFLFICFTVALLDETIQGFVGRQSRVFDIWIDIFGALTGFLVYMLCRKIKKAFLIRKSKKKEVMK